VIERGEPVKKEQKGIRGETDRRLFERALMRRQIADKELAEYLATLPDVSGNAEEVVIEMEERD
jgi:hypothetical protein